MIVWRWRFRLHTENRVGLLRRANGVPRQVTSEALWQ